VYTLHGCIHTFGTISSLPRAQVDKELLDENMSNKFYEYKYNTYYLSSTRL
jgi:hypothetical protein